MKKFLFILLKHETDADVAAMLYAGCLVWLAALLRFCGGADGIGFWPVTQIILLSWGIAWFQKLLYWREQLESRAARIMRGVLWLAVPTAAAGLCAFAAGWFSGCPAWAGWVFTAAWAGTLASWWLCIQLLCRNETVEWNTMLTQFKEGGIRREETHHE